MQSDKKVDTTGLMCPMPIVKAKKALDELESGQVMEVVSTDKGSLNDFQAWVKQTNHELIEHSEKDGVFTFHVKKN
ncbi:Sulfurtransferase TusA [compost metagenome]